MTLGVRRCKVCGQLMTQWPHPRRCPKLEKNLGYRHRDHKQDLLPPQPRDYSSDVIPPQTTIESCTPPAQDTTPNQDSPCDPSSGGESYSGDGGSFGGGGSDSSY